jgi:hypothetical protein
MESVDAVLAFEMWVYWGEHPHTYDPTDRPYHPCGLDEGPEYNCRLCGCAEGFEMHLASEKPRR